jgi:hypothetical protein
MLYYEAISSLMYDITNQMAPPNISQYFTPVNTIHSHNTRSLASGKFYQKYARLKPKNESFSIIGSKLWNGIPEHLKNLSKKIFKSKLKIQLFHVQENEDVYIDFHSLLTKMSNIQIPTKYNT